MPLIPRLDSLRRLVALVLLYPALGCAVQASQPDASAQAVRVMSFNIRYATAQDGENAWDKRADFVFDIITRFKPDLIGFQEVIARQYDAIVERMPEYAFHGVARDDGKRRGEWSLIGFRKDKYTATTNGDFWLSEEPSAIGSKSWDAAITRICSWVRLRETATKREFLFANTHFDHKGVIARQESSRLLSRQLTTLAEGKPTILSGDFNFTEDDPAYTALVHAETPGAINWIDSYRTVHPQRLPDEATFHGFKGGTTGSRIDYIFHTEHLQAVAAEIDRTSRNGRWPSDHFPVTAILQWNPAVRVTSKSENQKKPEVQNAVNE